MLDRDVAGAPPVRDAVAVTRPLVLMGALALLLTAAGAVVLVAATPAEASFGWFAYGAPPPEQLFTSAAVIWTGAHLAGAVLVVLGLITVAAAAGYRAGRLSGRAAR